MSFRLMPFALSAVLSVPALCQASPYDVTLVYAPGGQSAYSDYPDVDNVFGLNVKRMLTATNNNTNVVHGRSSFAFMRDWNGENTLSLMVGATPANTALATPAVNVSVYYNEAGATGYLQLGAPVFTVWSLLADQGAFVIEASEFSYTSRQFLPLKVKN